MLQLDTQLATALYSKHISSGVSHSDGSCVLGRIHSDVSSNIPKKVYHIVTDNFVNLLHISYAWLYKTECWGRKFHAFSFNSHRNCRIFMTNFNFIFDTICVPYIFRKSIFGWNCDHDTPLCDTPDDLYIAPYLLVFWGTCGIVIFLLVQVTFKGMEVRQSWRIDRCTERTGNQLRK